MTMLTLYDYLPSQNAYKVRLLLNHLERPHRTEMVSIFEGEGQREEYLCVNPTVQYRPYGWTIAARLLNQMLLLCFWR